MGASDFAYIDKVEASIHISRKFAIKKIDEDAAGGRWLGIVGANGGCGVEDHDLLARFCSLDRL